MVRSMGNPIGEKVPRGVAADLSTSAPEYVSNSATRVIASMLGVLLGISSINHGILETLQGNRPTPGLVVKALGSGYSWTVWTQGSEPAFTLVPNFLLTGLIATFIGLLMILWSLRFLQKSYGPTVFLLLGVTSFLTGGGMAQVLLFTLNWLVATRIRASLGFWRWLIPRPLCRVLGGIWRWTLAAAAILFLSALEIAVIGYIPGVPGQPELLRGVLMFQLAPAIVLSLLLTFLSGFAHDIEVRRRA